MDQAPNYYNYMPTQFGPAAQPQPYMAERFQPQYYEDQGYSFHEQHPSVDPFMDAVSAKIWAAVQAYHSMDAQSLHLAYANLGLVLGIDRACTYFVQSYSSANSAYGGRKMFYKKDWENLEPMVADIDNEKKILHVEKFMRRRGIPGYVSLYTPKQIVCKSVEKAVKQEKISCVDDACRVRDEVMRLDVACQTQDQSTISLNVACQTEKVRSFETSCQTESFASSETSCQTECFVSLDVVCQTVEKSAGLCVSCQTTDTCEKASRKSVDKVVRKDSDNRKRAHVDKQDSRSTKRSKHSESTRDARSKVSSQDAKSSMHHDGSGRTTEGSEHKKLSRKDSDSHKPLRVHKAETSATSEQRPILNSRMRRALRRAKSLYESKKKMIEAVDDEKSSRKSSDKIVLKDSSDNCKRDRDDKSETRIDRSVFHSKRSDSKNSAQKPEATKSSASKTDAVDGKQSSRDSVVTSSGKVSVDSKRKGEVAETKRSSPDCKENAQNLGKSDCHCTKLVIQNLHPLVNDADISTIFNTFKSYKSCKVNFYNYGKLCAADVVFEEEADALEAKNQFDGKKLDGFPMQIVVVKSEKITSCVMLVGSD